MIWLIATATILSIIFAFYTHAKALEKLTNEEKPSFQQTIFLKTAPSEGFWDPTDSLLNTPLSGRKFVATDSKILLVTRLMFPEPPGYGLYSYLLFGSRSKAGRNKRYAAARGYCQNFPPIEEALKIVGPKNLNAFLIPTRPETPISYCENPQTLVDDYYDYALSERILQNIHLEGDVIYLVACDKPIWGDGCHREKMLVFNLTTVDERLSELCILDFRDQTRHPEYWSRGYFDSELLLINFRTKILPQLAAFISFAEAAAKGR
jgi:hypothetical protein